MQARADYELTNLGRSLLEPMDAIRIWSEAHAAKVLAAREIFDDK
ncbi:MULTISPECIES: hypothetical protein [unclassified Arthrobacter]|nr:MULTISPECIES: hypothetical protein [unclassified Arthrobacter]